MMHARLVGLPPQHYSTRPSTDQVLQATYSTLSESECVVGTPDGDEQYCLKCIVQVDRLILCNESTD